MDVSQGLKGAGEMAPWIKGPVTKSEDLRSLGQTQWKAESQLPKVAL